MGYNEAWIFCLVLNLIFLGSLLRRWLDLSNVETAKRCSQVATDFCSISTVVGDKKEVKHYL